MGDVLATHLLHLVAIVGVKVSSPARADVVVRLIANRLPPLDVSSSRHVAGMLEPMGTCLTRSLVVASRLPGSTLVIGVEPRKQLSAHAWVEVEGVPLRTVDVWGYRLASWTGAGRNAPARATITQLGRSLE
jgi:hypothetical protein